MMKYAFINADNVCDGEGYYDPPLVPQPAYAIIIADDETRMGQKWTGKKWVAVAPQADQRPTVVVESIAADAAHNAHTIVADNMAEVRTIVGATLSITVRMEVGGQLYPANESFDMPITSVDGRVRPVRVPFENGRATFAVRMDDARIWQVSEAMINSALPADRHMRFTGLRVVAAEV